MARPFEGIRIIDITHVLAGPFAAYQLGLMGADVIKVEHPDDPDQSRDSGSDNDLNHAGMGTGFLTQGSNKRAITLNLKTEQGREILKKLVATADVLVENYRPGAFEALGSGLRGDAQDQSEADLRVVLRVRPGRAAARADRVRPRDPVHLRHHGDDRHAGGEPDQDRRAGDRLRDRHDGSVCAVRGAVPARAHRAGPAHRHGDAGCGDHPDGLARDRLHAQRRSIRSRRATAPGTPPAWPIRPRTGS